MIAQTRGYPDDRGASESQGDAETGGDSDDRGASESQGDAETGGDSDDRGASESQGDAETGGDSDGWRSEVVDLVADYQHEFGTDPPPLRGVALMTDADNRCLRAEARYADFQFLPPA